MIALRGPLQHPPPRSVPPVPPPQLQLDSLFDSPWQDLPEPTSAPAPAPPPPAVTEIAPPPQETPPSDPYAEVLEELLQGRQEKWWQGPVGQKPRAPKLESTAQVGEGGAASCQLRAHVGRGLGAGSGLGGDHPYGQPVLPLF